MFAQGFDKAFESLSQGLSREQRGVSQPFKRESKYKSDNAHAETGHFWLVNQHVSYQALEIHLGRRFQSTFLVFVLGVDVVSDSHEFLVPIRCRQDENGDAEDLF